MQITGITTQIYKPQQVQFSGTFFRRKPPVINNDTFVKTEEKNPELDKQIDEFYLNLEKKLGILDKTDVIRMAESIKAQVPEASKEEIYYTMGVLSEYSSYKSWEKLKSALEEHAITNICDTQILYQNNSSRAIPINLSAVMSYLFVKNCPELFKYSPNKKEGLILDKKLCETLRANPEYKHQIFKSNVVPIYIENFENGYNFLNQSENFENYTVEILKRAKNRKDFKKSLYTTLNKDTLDKIHALGIHPIILKSDINQPPKASNIAKALNPIIISKKDLSNFTYKFKNGKTNVLKDSHPLDFLQEMGVIVTPKELSRQLKEINTQINDYIRENDLKNVYYTIPNPNKSFGLINYMFQKANNIPSRKFIYYDFNMSDSTVEKSLKFLPEKSTIIVLDDAALSGESLINSVFHFLDFTSMDNDFNKRKEIHFIIAPIFATAMGRKNIETEISNAEYHSGKIIANKILPECSKELKKGSTDNSFLTYIGDGCLTALILPYMGPDTNHEWYEEFYQKMLFNPHAQKEL